MTRSGFFFDARFIRIDHHDGISRFSVGLLTALLQRTEVTAIISDLRQLVKLPKGCKYLLVNDPTSAREIFLGRTLNRAGAKVVFSPMQTMGAFGRRFRLILTLHDLIYYRHPAPPPAMSLPIRLLWRLYHLTYWPQRWMLNRADAVVTVSNTTKRLMLNHRLTRRPISVVYNSAGSLSEYYEHRAPEHRPRMAQKLCYMGSFMGYKNVETLIAGMAWLPDYELHLLSKIKPERKSELSALIPTGAKVVFHDGVSEAQYHEELDSSVALVTASLDEGFGIPLVEAMSRGIPVVVSNIEIFSEIGGEAALFFEPTSPGGFAAAVKRLDSNPDWMDASRASLKVAERFNWDRSAAELIVLVDGLSS